MRNAGRKITKIYQQARKRKLEYTFQEQEKDDPAYGAEIH